MSGSGLLRRNIDWLNPIPRITNPCGKNIQHEF
jgi:hypothetical protein